jgi:peptidoglycan/xylan/chitin deacetylase (PgdA/CDA1 family)
MGITAALKRMAGRLAPQLVLVRGASASGAVALTFDDGPHPNTPSILEVLAAYEAPATFFVQGANAVAAPDVLRTIVARGHVVGNHGFEHRHWTRHPTTAAVQDAERAQAVIDGAVGRPQPRLYRPPYGEITPQAAIRLWRLGYRIVLWSTDPRDSFPGTREAVLSAASVARAGDILLLHDDGEHTVAALPHLIEGIRRRGLAIRPLNALRAAPGSDAA